MSAEEKRNVINLANAFGYKVKPIVPSFVDLTFTSNVNVSSGDASKVDYSHAGMFDAGIELVSSVNSDVIFIHFDELDAIGHAHGFSGNVQEYVDKVNELDSYTSELYDIIQNKKLVLLSTCI